jgi:hypothetical protein
MKVVCSSDVLVSMCHTIRCHNPEHHNMNLTTTIIPTSQHQTFHTTRHHKSSALDTPPLNNTRKQINLSRPPFLASPPFITADIAPCHIISSTDAVCPSVQKLNYYAVTITSSPPHCHSIRPLAAVANFSQHVTSSYFLSLVI